MSSKKDTTTQAVAVVQEVPVPALSEKEQQQIEDTFREAKDFRSLGEKITAPIDSIISETAQIIDSDPIMNVSDTLTAMNNEVQGVYREIIDNDGTLMRIAKSLPILGALAKSLDAKWDEASFNIKKLEGKIATIFSGFDQSYQSLNTSVDMQKKFLEGIDENL